MASKSKTLATSAGKSDLSGHEALDRENGNVTLAGAKKLWLDLRSGAKHESKKKNLDLLWEVLEGMRKSGSEKFTVAEVGRAHERKGGPKVQSLRNAQGRTSENLSSPTSRRSRLGSRRRARLPWSGRSR